MPTTKPSDRSVDGAAGGSRGGRVGRGRQGHRAGGSRGRGRGIAAGASHEGGLPGTQVPSGGGSQGGVDMAMILKDIETRGGSMTQQEVEALLTAQLRASGIAVNVPLAQVIPSTSYICVTFKSVSALSSY